MAPGGTTTGKAAPRVVIAHDFMEAYGGAERVTHEMARAFPGAPVIAIMGRGEIARRMGVADRFRTLLPPRERLLRRYRSLTPLYPLITNLVSLTEADVLLTSSYAFAHRLRTANRAPQVCYCHTPIRFAWTVADSYRAEYARGGAPGAAFDAFAAAMRWSDRRSSARVTRYLTQSPYTVEQIRRFYDRDAEAIGAPVDCEVFHPADAPAEDYYLLCARLFEPSKRSLYVIDAFRELGMRLIVAGGGPGLDQLRAACPPNVELVGHLEDEQLVELMQRCAALIFPSRDAFGLIPVETMACGRPVIALAEGGALQTVVPGVTGELFREQSAAAVVAAVRAFRPEDYDSAQIREHARQWDRPVFRARLVAAVQQTAALDAAVSEGGG